VASGPKIPVGSVVAAVGSLLLIVSLFLHWYDGLTGWTVFEIVDLVLLSLALSTIFAIVAGSRLVKQDVSPSVMLIITLTTLVVVVAQLLNDPPAVAGDAGPEQDIGLWLALGGAALMVAGALLSTTRVSLAVEPRRREESPAEEPTAPLGGAAPKPETPPERP
jgi:peptidoglycan/LPS O-acetylase OafA/YrhL